MTANEVVKEMQDVLESLAKSTEKEIIEALANRPDDPDVKVAVPVLRSFIRHLRSWKCKEL